MASFYKFQFSPLKSTIRLSMDTTLSLRKNKELSIVEKLLMKQEIIEEIVKNLTEFMDSAKDMIIIEKLEFLQNLKKKLSIPNREEEESADLSIEELDFLNKAFHLFVNSLVDLSLKDEEQKVCDLLKTFADAPILFVVDFDIKRGFEIRETKENKKKEIDEKQKNKSLILGDFNSKYFQTLQKYVEDSIDEKTDISNWKLVYRATRDGFGGKDFHHKCDSCKRTLVIIRSANRSIFGGFTTKSWVPRSEDNQEKDEEEEECSKTDEKALIFSLYSFNQPNREPKKFMASIRPQDAIYCHPGEGPIFGGCQDLTICDDSNVTGQSYSELNHAYDAGMVKGSEEAKNYLCGSEYFFTAEIEVYAI